MSMLIKDGTGSGKAAKVSSNNRLAVNAITETEVTHISSVDAKAYQFHFKRTIAAGSTDEPIGILTYNGVNKLQIESVVFSRLDVAMSTGGQGFITMTSEPTYTSGGDAIDPVNMNIGSSNQPTVTAYSGTTDLVISTASSNELLDVAFQDHSEIYFNGAVILNKGGSIAISCQSKNIGDIINVNVIAFEVEEVI